MTFAIISYYITAFGQSGKVWEKVTDPNPDNEPNLISAREARSTIREYGLEKVWETEDGEIWDFPDERWTRKWRGIFARRRIEKRGYAKRQYHKKKLIYET